MKAKRRAAIEQLRNLRNEFSPRVPDDYRFKRSDAYDEECVKVRPSQSKRQQ
jgi:hypothetical protein